MTEYADEHQIDAFADRCALDGHERILLALVEGRTEEAAHLLAEHIATAKAAVLTDMFAGKEVRP